MGDQGALFEKTAPWTPAKAFNYYLYHCLTAFFPEESRKKDLQIF